MTLSSRTKHFLELFVKFLIVFLGFSYIWQSIHKDIFQDLEGFQTFFERAKHLESFKWLFIFMVISLNWFIEAWKWKYLLKGILQISTKLAVKSVLIALSVGVLTPLRIAEIPLRASFLPKENQSSAVYLSLLNSFSQLSVTIIVGSISLFYIYLSELNFENILFTFFVVFSISLVVWVFIFIFRNRLRKYKARFYVKLSYRKIFTLQVFSTFRYFLFLIQYFLIFNFFEISVSPIHIFVGVSAVLFFTNIAPVMQIFDIAIRGATSIYIFSIWNISQVSVLFVFMLVWLLSLVIPVIIGQVFLFSHHFVREKA